MPAQAEMTLSIVADLRFTRPVIRIKTYGNDDRGETQIALYARHFADAGSENSFMLSP